MTITTQNLLRSPLARRLELIHLDTSDHRTISNVGRFDFRNVALALFHGIGFAAKLLVARPDLIYVPIARNRPGFLRDFLFLLPARLSRRPVALHLHAASFVDYWKSEAKWKRAIIHLAFGPRVYGIVLGESLRGAFGTLVPPDRISVVPNGIADVGVTPDGVARRSMVLHLSTLWSEKGLFDVLAVARAVHRAEIDARFVLAGNWYSAEERREAAREIERSGLEAVVECVSPVGDVEKRRLLAEASLMLLPSRSEGQPLVVLETLAAGVPIVATRVGALGETVTHGHEGFLTPVSDTASLVEHTARLLRDHDLRRQMGNAARARYLSTFGLEQFGTRLADVLEQIAARDSDERARRPASTSAEARP